MPRWSPRRTQVLSRLVVCGLASGFVVALVACSPNGRSARDQPPSRTDLPPGMGADQVTDPAAAETTTVEATTTTLPKTVLSTTLGSGAQGEEVKALQQRLNDLHFDVDKVDGIFGKNTEMAVWAYQSLIMNLRGKDITGQVSPELWSRIQEPLGLANKRPDATSTHVEVFLAAQTMALYVKKDLRLITHVSTGTGETWTAIPRILPRPGSTTTSTIAGQRPQKIKGLAITPGGVFRVNYKRDGWYDVTLGRVFNPIFFNAGIAIHGYEDVPKTPASHGCVRVPMHVAKYLPELIHEGDQVFVWDGVAEPEKYGAQRPPFDEPDPTDTTTTSTSTTTTTIKPTTTIAATTTSKVTTPTVTTAPGPTTTVHPTTVATPPGPATTAPTTAPTATTTTKP
jgi:peptidoglycan hydrolase-like protein with peptidoglycan-binding domain